MQKNQYNVIVVVLWLVMMKLRIMLCRVLFVNVDFVIFLFLWLYRLMKCDKRFDRDFLQVVNFFWCCLIMLNEKLFRILMYFLSCCLCFMLSRCLSCQSGLQKWQYEMQLVLLKYLVNEMLFDRLFSFILNLIWLMELSVMCIIKFWRLNGFVVDVNWVIWDVSLYVQFWKIMVLKLCSVVDENLQLVILCCFFQSDLFVEKMLRLKSFCIIV